MAKKQRRYLQADLEKALPQLLGGNVSLILQDGQVHYLRLVQFDHQQLTAVDGMQRTHQIPLQLIAEVIAEKHA